MLFFSGVGLILDWSWSWTETCLLVNDDLSKMCFWIINHFTWNDRWSISTFWIWIVHHPITNFQAKVVMLWRIFFTTIDRCKNIFVYRQWKRNCWSTKIFFITRWIFLTKKLGDGFFPKMSKFGGGQKWPKSWKNGGVCTPFWRAVILR